MADLGTIDAFVDGIPYDAFPNFSLVAVDAPMVMVVYVPVAAPAVPAPPPASTVYQLGASTLAGVSGDFGSDSLVFPGVDGNFTLVKDGRVIAEALARRLSTPRGSLPFHPDYGLDLRSYLNEAVTADLLYRMKAAVELECEQDERIDGAKATITYAQSTMSMKVRVDVTTTTAALRFVLSVSQVSVDLLNEE